MSLSSGLLSGSALSPPAAKKIPKVFTLHGATHTDNYAWMKNRKDPDLQPYLRAENAFTQAVMADTRELQDALFAEMQGRVKFDSSTVPARHKKHVYYTRTLEGEQYSIRCRRSTKPGSHEQILLDENQLAKGEKFFALGDYVVSPSDKLLAYTVDVLGYRQYTLYVKNIGTGELINSATAERVTSVVWADNRTLLYVTEDEVTKRSNKLWRHRLGSKEHVLLKEEKDEYFELGVESSSCDNFIFLTTGSHTTATVAFMPFGKSSNGAKFKDLAPRRHKMQYFADSDGKHFYILTNSGKAKDRRVMRVPCNAYQRKNWKEVLPHKPGRLLDNIHLFKDHLVVYALEDGLSKIRIEKLSTGEVHWVEFPESIYEVVADDNFEFETNKLRLDYQSMVTPPVVWDYDMDTREKSVLKQISFAGYDQSQFNTKRISATAEDGTKIHMSIVYKGELVLDGSRPCLLYGYGAYGLPLNPNFRHERLGLLDRNVLYVMTHIRGGSENGEEWHEQGKMMNKMNTFTDFIACRDALVREGYAHPGKIVLQGGSAGGLLVGSCINMRPDMASAAIIQMPFLDVINTMLDTSNPLTVAEFEEFGNPAVEAEYRYMVGYSPYDNLVTGKLPAVLVEGAEHDSQVGFWEPAKYVAKMRELNPQADPRNILLNMIMDGGGHHGASGRFTQLREWAFSWAFALKHMGLA